MKRAGFAGLAAVFSRQALEERNHKEVLLISLAIRVPAPLPTILARVNSIAIVII
jgi:hypothetical protein